MLTLVFNIVAFILFGPRRKPAPEPEEEVDKWWIIAKERYVEKFEEDEDGNEDDLSYWQFIDGVIVYSLIQYRDIGFVIDGEEMRTTSKGPFFSEGIADMHLGLIKGKTTNG